MHGAGSLTSEVPRVDVGPFPVADVSRSELVALLVAAAASRSTPPTRAFALHVGGLNARRQEGFVRAMRDADIVYADGGSVVLLSRLAGARSVERAPTTDVGWEVLQGLTEALGHRPRLALVGGEGDLAARAGAVLESEGVAEIVFTADGFRTDWAPVLEAMRERAPEVAVIGLGAPREMVWTHDWRDQLPGSLVLTCGGWFGHLTGEERRAPKLLRRSGLEWLARVAQAPSRLGPRYARGVGSTLSMSVTVVRERRRRKA